VSLRSSGIRKHLQGKCHGFFHEVGASLVENAARIVLFFRRLLIVLYQNYYKGPVKYIILLSEESNFFKTESSLLGKVGGWIDTRLAKPELRIK